LAFCQLDLLGRLKTVPRTRKALTELPETFDETYERILSSIPCQSRKFVHKALQFLAYDGFTIELNQLADAVIIDDEQLSFDSGDRFLKPIDLLDVCTCLVSYNDRTGEIVLAHYTVREYLESGRAKPDSFRISAAACDITFAKSAVIYMFNADYQQADNYPFLLLALTYWSSYAGEVEKNGGDLRLSELVLQLLSPDAAHFLDLLEYWRINDSEYLNLSKFEFAQEPKLLRQWGISVFSA
jgi:hypothetical protein